MRYFPFRGIVPPRGGLDGAGLNFLFDFNLSNDNQWVGYDMLCHESEVWDYIRQRCHPMICGKGHVLLDGACEAMGGSNETQNGGRDDIQNSDEVHDHEPKENLSNEPECFRILIHDNEYTVLEGPSNGTLAVNLSTGNSKLIFFRIEMKPFFVHRRLVVFKSK